MHHRPKAPSDAASAWAKQVVRCGHVTSTMDVARAGLLHDGVAEGTTWWAESQSAGRGRNARSWASAAGRGLFFTTVVYPQSRHAPGSLSLVFALAVAEAMRALAIKDCGLKWPNDVVVGEHKLAGLLLEQLTLPQGQAVLVGVGLNVRPPPKQARYRWPPTSMAEQLAGHPPEDGPLLATLLGHMAAAYARWQHAGFAVLRPRFEALHVLQNRRIVADSLGTSSAWVRGVADDGQLQIEVIDGQDNTRGDGNAKAGSLRSLMAGEVALLAVGPAARDDPTNSATLGRR